MSQLQLHAVRGSATVPLPVPGTATDVHELFPSILETPAGIYSALRSYQGNRFLNLDAHLARCRRCVKRAGWSTDFDLEGLARAIDRTVSAGPQDEAGRRDVRLRFDLLERPIRCAGTETQVLLGLAPHTTVPADILQHGAHLELAPPGLSRPAPLIKFTDWVIHRQVCHRSSPACFEHLLLDSSHRVLEGISSNFFAVRDGVVMTAAQQVLEGITRSIVCDLVRERGLELRWEAIALEQLASCDEAFITSSTREIVPVTRVADQPIGPGRPGPLVMALRDDFRRYVQQHALRAGSSPP